VATKVTKSFLDDAPGPSPWYLLSRGPKLPGLTWVRTCESKAAAGKTCLMRGDDVVLLVNVYCYVELDARLFADAGSPLVGAGGCVAGFAGCLALPTGRVDIGPSTE